MALTDMKIRSAKPREKQYKLTDGDGLYLLVTPQGSKLWRFRYRIGGKEKLLALGSYPEVSLYEARQARDEARRMLRNNIDPSVEKRQRKLMSLTRQGETFGVIAMEWYERFKGQWAESHAEVTKRRLERELLPWLGHLPIREITATDLLSVLRRIEGRGILETAHRVRTVAGQVFRYAIATGRADRDPSRDLKGALPPPRERHLAAITDPKEVGALLRAIDGYRGHFVVRCALKLAPLVFVRPGELRHAEWSEIDLENAVWRIPAEKMKNRQPHLVPLSRQAVEILSELKPLTGTGRWVFPSLRSDERPMSENAVLAALRRLGYDKEEMCGHGWRATARTLLDEQLKENPAVIEAQLAHKVPDSLGRAYNRTTYLEERTRMMQRWADYLDELRRTT